MTGATTAAFICAPTHTLSIKTPKQQNKMYGLIGKITAKDGQRDKLIKILLEGSAEMPGCLSYIVSKDAKENNMIWVTEVWDSKESHKASLELSSVEEAINKGRPLISEFNEQIEMEPVGGHGWVSTENK